MISGYWCKFDMCRLRSYHMPNPSLCFIGYLTRPLGFFFVSVDTEKVAKRRQRRCHAAQDRSWGLTFAKFCGIQRLIRDWSALRIYCRVPFSAAGIAHPFESMDDLYIVILSSRWEYMASYFDNSKYACQDFLNFIGYVNSVPDGSSPRGYSQVLVLGCRLTSLLSLSLYCQFL